MQKINYLSVFFFTITGCTFAQTATVVDKTDLRPLSEVAIYSNNPKTFVTTSIKGRANLSGFKDADSIVFQTLGYRPLVYSYGQLETMKFIISMTEKPYSLDEVVVSASRFEEKRADVPQQIQVIRSKDLEFTNQQTSADVLQNTGNILVQKSQMAGGSPIIRGFEANKVLIVVDGVRMNNAIYRGGHLQSVITLDNSILEKTEIVFGPGSVVYGSDALGGVMHFYTKNPVLADSSGEVKVKANTFTRYSTAGNEKTAHADVSIGFKKIASLTGFTFSDFEDLVQGNKRSSSNPDWGKRTFFVARINGYDSAFVNENVNIQKESGYKQYNLLQKFLYQHGEQSWSVLNLQYSTSGNIPRYDRLTQTTSVGQPKYAEWYYGPQTRLLGSYSLNFGAKKGLFGHARIILGYQNIEESRHNRKFNESNRTHRTENLDIFSLTSDFEKALGKHEIRYGMEGVYNIVNSSAFSDDIVTGKTSPLDTRYPDGGSNMRSLAAYATHTYEAGTKLILTEGIRFSNVNLNAEFTDTSFFSFPFREVNQRNNAITGSLGLVYNPGGDWRINLLASSGFRAPNVDDLSKVFESIPGNVIVPNPDLKPEYTYNGELGLSKTIQNKITLGTNAFYTFYLDAITTQPGIFLGKDSILYEGQLSRVSMNVNESKAFIYGLNAYVFMGITENISLTSTLNYTYGRIKADTGNYPLDHIPPLFGKTTISFSMNKFKGEFYLMYNGWKYLKDYNPLGEDNFSFATSEGMPSWVTLNIHAAYQIHKNIQLQIALENILDQNYRIFGSGISGAGRNFVITLRGRF